MNIRKASIIDIDILIKLRLDFLVAVDNLTADEEPLIRSQLTTYYTKHINNDFVAILAETVDNVVSAAFLVISERPASRALISGKTGTLINVLTYPKYRRNGFATKVICQIIDEAKQLGVSWIDLSATQEGKPLYEKLGFIELKSKSNQMKLQLFG